ncbi:hypothetical protein PV326_001744, partial [Microctonus aethiopoides]
HERHKREMAEKAQKAANATWGLCKRAGRGKKKERLYLMNALVRSVAMYGVEVWGWGSLERIMK